MDLKILNATCPNCRTTFLTSIDPSWSPPLDKIDPGQANILCTMCESQVINDLYQSMLLGYPSFEDRWETVDRICPRILEETING